MLETLITSKTRIKLIIKFFLNPTSKSYLRELEGEFNEGSNSIRLELNKFEKANLLKSESSGNRKFFFANQQHPLFFNLNSLVKKHLGIDSIIHNVVGKVGSLHCVYLTGTMAKGLNSGLIDLILVGEEIDRNYLNEIVEKVEKAVERKVRYAVYTVKEFRKVFGDGDIEGMLMIWSNS